MPEVFTIRTILANKVWALLGGSAAITDVVVIGNRKPLTEPDGWLRLYLAARAPADFPKIAVALTGPWSVSDGSDVSRYAFRAGTPTGMVKETNQTITIVLTHRTQLATDNDPLDIAVAAAISAAGPTLGLVPTVFPYVLRGRIEASPDYSALTLPSGFPRQSFGQPRQQTTFTIPVSVRWQTGTFPTQTV